MIARDAFVAEVLTYVGTPFEHHGRTPGRGLDCAGVVACALDHFGEAPPDIHYRPSPSEAEVFDGLAAATRPIAIEHREPGDVLTFLVGGLVVHMGVYIGVLESGPVECLVQPMRRRGIIGLTSFDPERSDVRACWRLKVFWGVLA